ncbi:MAG: hypothetical protein KY468_15225 [Armatimonadetes bacterium]|nr:hypothetical protein [Armatimonadota bacterium]
MYEYTESPGGAAAETDEPFDPYDPARWWTRRRALVPAYGEIVRGRQRDYLFGDRPGEFWALYFEKDLLTPLGRPDTDFLRRWMLRESSTDRCWVVDFDPRVYNAPLPHIECYAKVLSPSPVNRD